MATVLIAGGGTGGHVYPAVAIARALRKRVEGCEVLMAGTARGLEARVVPAEGLELLTIPVGGLKGKSWSVAARNLLGLPRALMASGGHLRRRRPGVVIGVGGYASGPVVAAAILRRIPTLIHEQNMIPGSTNGWLAPFVSRIAVSFEATRDRLGGRGTLTGNPVREEFAGLEPVPASKPRRHLLIFGGSQGAAALNRAMIEAAGRIAAWPEPPEITHQTGTAGLDEVREAYAAAGLKAAVHAFIDPMWRAVADADLVLCRAGATTVAELAVAGRGSVLVPLPQAIHDHQTGNARELERAGGAILFPQSELGGTPLAERLRELLQDGPRLAEMGAAARRIGRADAAARIAEIAAGLLPAPREGPSS